MFGRCSTSLRVWRSWTSMSPWPALDQLVDPVSNEAIRLVSHAAASTSFQSTASSTPRPQPASNSAHGPSTVNAREAAKFRELAGKWWDPLGPFKPLHHLNPTRVEFMVQSICDHLGLDASLPAPLRGLDILDVGCGGGILAESLAKRGAAVLGIDVNEEGLAAARAHAQADPRLASLCSYRATTLEDLAAAGNKFDVVIASEVIEHVRSLPTFVSSLAECARLQAPVLVTTLNRTPASYMAAIVGAEYVLRWVPKGTHHWSKFLTPTELTQLFRAHTPFHLWQLAGMEFNPVTGTWSLGTNTSINYAACFTRAAANAPLAEEPAEYPPPEQ
ncbi:COQ3 [Auxenochlorella protothecoides x Auxenochlorella symbiontica]